MELAEEILVIDPRFLWKELIVRSQGSFLRVCFPRLLIYTQVRTQCDIGGHQIVGSTILTLIGVFLVKKLLCCIHDKASVM